MMKKIQVKVWRRPTGHKGRMRKHQYLLTRADNTEGNPYYPDCLTGEDEYWLAWVAEEVRDGWYRIPGTSHVAKLV
jgi:glycosidase